MNRSELETRGKSRFLEGTKDRNARTAELVLDADRNSPLMQNQEIELFRLLRTVWANRTLVLGIAVLCAAIGTGIAMVQAPMYRSQATVELLGINENFMNLREVNPNAPSTGLSPTDSYVSTEIELLQSQALIRRVVEKLHLAEKPAPANHGLIGSVKSMFAGFGFGGPAAPESLGTIVGRAQQNLHVSQVRESNLLEITYSDRDPNVAAEFINTLTQEAIQTNMDERWNLNARVGTLLSKQMQILRDRMEKAANELQTYSKDSGLLYTADKSSVAETQLTEVESELARAQGDRIQKQSQYELARGADPDSLPAVLDNGPLRDYQTKLADLKRQYAEMIATRTPENVKVIKLKAQIDELESTMGRERTNILSRIQNEYNTAVQREKMLKKAYQAQASLVSDQSGKAVHYNTLKHEMETTRDLYEAMMRRVNDAEMVSAIRASDIRMVDPALPPNSPHTPNKPLLAGVGLLSGLLIGFTTVFVREQRDKTIQQPGYSVSLLNIAELGVIPSAKSDAARLGPGKQDGANSKASLSLSSNGSGRRAAIAENGLLKDSFRGVVNSILFAETEHNALRVLLVSSPNAGEGKTTSVCNLGASFAEIGRRVLLIDADFRKPRLHEIFGIPNDKGLLNLLAEKGESSAESLNSFVRPTGVPRLSVLTAGAASVPVVTLLHSDRLAGLFEHFRSEYDLVLIDSAPLLLVPESRILARSTDGLVLVLRAGVTTPEMALAARRRALEDGTLLVGTVLNDWKPDTTDYYRYYSNTVA
jgi:polysaccharide biosynthesis transport protein